MNPRHQRLYRAIVAHISDKGYAPTIRELIAMTDYTSTSMVSYGLSVLRAAGWIDYVDGESRTITVPDALENYSKPEHDLHIIFKEEPK